VNYPNSDTLAKENITLLLGINANITRKQSATNDIPVDPQILRSSP